MLLFRLTDADDDATDEYARGPKGLLDFDWFDKHGNAMPFETQRGLSNNLMMPPSGPEDPLWPLARYGVPRPPFGGTGPFFGFPNSGGLPLPGYPAPQGWNVARTPFLQGYPEAQPPHGPVAIQPIGTARWSAGAADPMRPPVRGLADMLLQDDNAGIDGAAPSDSETAATLPDSDPYRAAVLAQAAGSPAQNRPSLDYSLDAIERNFRAMVPGWRKQNLPQAATNLEWFLDGSGKPRIIDRDEARQMEPIRRAQDSIEASAERSLLDPRGHLRDLADLEDGQTVQFRDEPKHVYGNIDFARHVANPNTRDFALAFGNTGVQSPVTLSATRVGDEIHVDGTVEHHWRDRYDFHPERYPGFGGFGAKGAAALEQYRGAKPFAIRSSWPRRVSGTIRIKNGELSDPKFEWEDIEQ